MISTADLAAEVATARGDCAQVKTALLGDLARPGLRERMTALETRQFVAEDANDKRASSFERWCDNLERRQALVESRRMPGWALACLVLFAGCIALSSITIAGLAVYGVVWMRDQDAADRVLDQATATAATGKP